MQILFYTLCVFSVNGQDGFLYAIQKVPDRLLQGVNSVIRYDSSTLVVTAPGSANLSAYQVVTILNPKGAHALNFYQYVDKFISLESAQLNLWDGQGRLLSSLKKKDLQFQGYQDGFSLVQDGKLMYGSFKSDQYPVTIEITYALKYNGVMDYEDLYLSEPLQSIQRRVHTVKVPSQNPLRFKNYQTTIAPDTFTDLSFKQYKWTIENIKGYQQEKGAAMRDRPTVRMAPTLFDMERNQGDMSSWASLGKWQWDLIGATNILPENSHAFYKNMVQTANSSYEKISILYKYLQDNFRYVSIQLGIGGWKPFAATFVENNKYGDCKALTNYMQAMLKVVGIKSYYAIVNAGNDQVQQDPDFPSMGFNHVILCVPQLQDTLWLECTSNSQPMGKLGSFTENRNALLITELGGKLVTTPRSNVTDNMLITTSDVVLQANGAGTVQVHIQYKGAFVDPLEWNLKAAEENDRLEFIRSGLGFKMPESIEVREGKDTSDEFHSKEMNLQFQKLPDFIAGGKQFLKANVRTIWNENFPEDTLRTKNYYFKYPFIIKDTVSWHLPEGFVVESLPESLRFKNDLGLYTSQVKYDPLRQLVVMETYFEFNRTVVKPEEYQKALQFFSKVLIDTQKNWVIKMN